MSTNDVRVALYRSFVERGRAPRLDELAAATGNAREETVQALQLLAAENVIAFRPGTDDLWLAHPFCATEAPFLVTTADRAWNAICIWDALGILALLEADGTVSTRCPDCGGDLEVTVVGGRVHGPSEAVVHFGVPARRWYEDIGFT